jgi:uridine phosphorylase
MFNHNRGLWGYTGVAADGRPLSIQSTGMGGPSAAIVAHELIELGARRLLRVGTCGGLTAELQLGQLLVVEEALSDDGTSQALGAGGPLAGVAGSAALLEALGRAGAELRAAAQLSAGTVVSSDLFYDAGGREPNWIAAGALAVEMETATIFTVAARRGVEAGSVLLVSNMLVGEGDGDYIGEQQLGEAEHALGRLAAAALES